MRCPKIICGLVLVGALAILRAAEPAGWEASPAAANAAVSEALAAAAGDGVLTLAEAKRVTLADNPSIAAAMARVDMAAAAVRETLAAYFPTLSVAASARHTEDTPLYLGGGEDADSSRLYSVGAGASWLVFDGFARHFRVAAARAAESASAEAARDVQRLLLQGVALSYYEALLARESMTIATRDRDFNRELSTETKKRFAAGVAARSDVLNFDVRVARADSSYLAAENDLLNARVTLAQLLGVPTAGLPASLEPAPLGEGVPATQPDLQTELAFALVHRPDYLALQHSLRQLAAQRQAAKGAYLPTVVLDADYGWAREGNARFNDDRDASSAVGIAAEWELFSGGATRARVARLAAEERALRREADALTTTIAAELRQRLDAIRLARQQAVLQERIRDMTRETRDLVHGEYSAGRANLTRLNEAQTDLVRAEAQLALARIRYWQVNELLAGTSGRILDVVEPAARAP